MQLTRQSRMSKTSTTSPVCIPVYQSELSSIVTSHQICLSKSSGFTILYKSSFHAYHGLCRCSHYRTTHPTSYQLQTLNRCYHTLRIHYLLPCIYQCHLRICYTFIDTYILMFWLPIDSSSTYRYPYTGSYATTFSIQNFYSGYSSWKFPSMIQCKYQISWYHTGWNYGSGNFTTPVQHMSKG